MWLHIKKNFTTHELFYMGNGDAHYKYILLAQHSHSYEKGYIIPYFIDVLYLSVNILNYPE